MLLLRKKVLPVPLVGGCITLANLHLKLQWRNLWNCWRNLFIILSVCLLCFGFVPSATEARWTWRRSYASNFIPKVIVTSLGSELFCTATKLRYKKRIEFCLNSLNSYPVQTLHLCSNKKNMGHVRSEVDRFPETVKFKMKQTAFCWWMLVINRLVVLCSYLLQGFIFRKNDSSNVRRRKWVQWWGGVFCSRSRPGYPGWEWLVNTITLLKMCF